MEKAATLKDVGMEPPGTTRKVAICDDLLVTLLTFVTE
jgi:hypothetical protein